MVSGLSSESKFPNRLDLAQSSWLLRLLSPERLELTIHLVRSKTTNFDLFEIFKPVYHAHYEKKLRNPCIRASTKSVLARIQGFRDNFPFPAWYLTLALNQNFQIDWISPNQSGYLDCCRQSLLN